MWKWATSWFSDSSIHHCASLSVINKHLWHKWNSGPNVATRSVHKDRGNCIDVMTAISSGKRGAGALRRGAIGM